MIKPSLADQEADSSFHEKAGLCQANIFTVCHSLISEFSGVAAGPRPGRAQRAGGKPGRVAAMPYPSLEGMAGGPPHPASSFVGSSPFLAPLPFALFWSHYRLCASWGPQSDDGCCSLIADLAARADSSTGAGPRTTRSHPNSASLPKFNISSGRDPLCHPCGRAKVRIPLRSPTACAGTPPVFARPLPAPASWRSFLRAAPAPIPSAVDHCPAQMGPECDARTAPTAFARTHLLPW